MCESRVSGSAQAVCGAVGYPDGLCAGEKDTTEREAQRDGVEPLARCEATSKFRKSEVLSVSL